LDYERLAVLLYRRKSISRETVLELSDSFEKLEKCDIFEMNKELLLTELKIDNIKISGLLSKLKLKDLIAHGAIGIAENVKISESKLKLLIELINSLTNKSKQDTSKLIKRNKNINQTSEMLLRCIIDELRNFKNLKSIQDYKLEKFWNHCDTKAPFEQDLTIKQFLSLDLEAVLLKRSVTSTKILAIVNAIENAMK
jgi:hypothetical protein